METQAFLAKYFDLKPMGRANKNMAFLSDDNRMVLSLTNMTLGGESEVRYPATFHIGFIQETEQRVNEINQRLKADGSRCRSLRSNTAPGRSTSSHLAASR